MISDKYANEITPILLHMLCQLPMGVVSQNRKNLADTLDVTGMRFADVLIDRDDTRRG